MADFTLRLQDSVEYVDFISDATSTYYLLDGTFDAPVPDPIERRLELMNPVSRNLISRSYENREITFLYQIKATTRKGIMDAANKVFRILARANLNKSISGGIIDGKFDYYPAANDETYSGDGGVVLKIQFGPTTGSNYTDELGTTRADNRVYIFRVIAGEQTLNNLFSADGVAINDGGFLATEVELMLECEPLAVGPPREVADVANLYSIPYPAGTSGRTNRIVITGANIPGSHDALVRMTTNTNGNGMIIARDYGRSIWNTPSLPKNISSGLYSTQFIPYGDVESSTGKLYEIYVNSLSPLNVKHRVDGGTWSANYDASTPFVRHEIETGVGYFTTVAAPSGLTPTNTLAFNTHQAYIAMGNTSDMYTNLATFMSDDGYSVTNAYVVAQPGVSGRYKIIASIDMDTANIEAQAYVFASNSVVTSDAFKTNWIRPPANTVYWMADLGVIDFTPRGSRGADHPDTTIVYGISLRFRLLEAVSASSDLTINGIYLIPCDDANSYIHAGWNTSRDGIEVYSNFNPSAPYIAESVVDYRTTSGAVDNLIVPLDESHQGSMITLIPNVTNTIMCVPIFGSQTREFRDKSTTTSTNTDRATVVIRPRYLLVG